MLSIVDFIKQRQAEMPPHLAGLPHNADEELTLRVTRSLAEETGVPCRPGDLWVRICDGTETVVHGPFSSPPHCSPSPGVGVIAFGYVTQRGADAIHKLQETEAEV